MKSTERPHPLTPLIRGWVLLVAALFTFGRDLYPNGQRSDGPPWWIVLATLISIAVLVALISVITWWYTRFLIDDDELRVETGMLNKRSKRIGFSRVQSVDVIQPLAARLFGLCELRIEAGAGDSGITLRYLTREKAYRLRDYLLTRAGGRRTTVAESARLPTADAFSDLAVHDTVLVRLSPRQLILGLLTSIDFLISVVALVVVLVVTWVSGVGLVALGGIFPFVIGTVTLIGRRVIAQFNYTLARTGDGLRITRGLTNLTSQSVPVDRIQGVRITQSWLWRRLGYHRVDIDVLGYAHSGDGDNDSHASSMLFPVATADQVRIAMAYLLPHGQDETVPLQPVPARASWLRWIGRPQLLHGWNDHVMVSEQGLLLHTRDIVPHAKTQSVRITQGPLQRRLALATVHIDNTDGPVTLSIPHLDTGVARSVFDGQLPRAAYARRLEAAERARLRDHDNQPPGPGHDHPPAH